ncbi:unnamed protein product [Ilex paraguariensis]|uniref:RING-type E3 ubiquitin transferase n=1 Tax=Ilex paraguariensis TaxID=185542 RepID=A0ABC8SQ11_9AQUA
MQTPTFLPPFDSHDNYFVQASSQQTPTWLPPLNSHDNHHIQVSARQIRLLQDDPRLPLSQFLIELNVIVDFYSQGKSVDHRFQGLCTWKTICIPCDSLSRQMICEIMHEVPFPLRRVHWEDRELDGNSSNTLLEDEDALIERVLNSLCSMRDKPYNSGRKVLPLQLEIKKNVTIPRYEFKAWTCWYDGQKSLNVDFERYYQRAISVPRSLMESDQSEIASGFRSIPATRSAIEALEMVRVDESDVCKELYLCPICQEEFLMGSKFVRMPCSMFHRECITRWLKGSHLCPLCRFVMPQG